jgi:hypothetical protein
VFAGCHAFVRSFRAFGSIRNTLVVLRPHSESCFCCRISSNLFPHKINTCWQQGNSPHTKSKPIPYHTMGQVQPRYDTTPHQTCQVCQRPCTNAYGERIMIPHKARSCTVCRAWYCGEHKVTHLRKRPYRQHKDEMANKKCRSNYKCRATCVDPGRAAACNRK